MASPDEDFPASARSGNDPLRSAGGGEQRREREGAKGVGAGHEEVYGPIRFRRYVKGDGRALILYTHGGPAQDAGAQDGPAHT
jgi:hypothetical protein